jgi:hypothetical protein
MSKISSALSYTDLQTHPSPSGSNFQTRHRLFTERGTVIDYGLIESTGNIFSPSKLLSWQRESQPLVSMPPTSTLLESRRPHTHSIVIQKFHGYVDEIIGEKFTAVFTDPSGQIPDLKASFSLDDVSEGDRNLVTENAVFYWVMSRERKPHGQISNKEVLIFRRFPMWKKSDLEIESPEVNALNEWLNPNTTP